MKRNLLKGNCSCSVLFRLTAGESQGNPHVTYRVHQSLDTTTSHVPPFNQSANTKSWPGYTKRGAYRLARSHLFWRIKVKQGQDVKRPEAHLLLWLQRPICKQNDHVSYGFNRNLTLQVIKL